MSILIFVIFFIFVCFNIPIAISLGLSSVWAVAANDFQLSSIATLMNSAISKSVLLAIPYFILAGVIMEYAGISKRLIDVAEVFFGHIKGGMIIVTCVVACFFAAISGSGPATVAAIGGILIPGMVRSGYNKSMSASLVAAAGGIGVIIPPSVAFVVYATLAEISVGTLFICGVIPGLMMGLFYCLAGYWSMYRDGVDKVKLLPKASGRDKLKALKDAFWGLMTPVIILGGIYGGIFTPTEAAGIAVVYGLIVGVFIYKELKWKDLWRLCVDSAVTSAVVMFILAAAGIFSWIMTTTGIAEDLSAQLVAISSNKYVLLLLINILFLIAGCFIEANSAFCIFLPILLPVLKEIGYDFYAFGVFMTTAFAVGMITPPVGANLYVASNVTGLKLEQICSRVLPFIFAGIVGCLLLSYFPQISLVLPKLFGML